LYETVIGHKTAHSKKFIVKKIDIAAFEIKHGLGELCRR
jgi:hypothetical protein